MNPYQQIIATMALWFEDAGCLDPQKMANDYVNRIVATRNEMVNSELVDAVIHGYRQGYTDGYGDGHESLYGESYDDDNATKDL